MSKNKEEHFARLIMDNKEHLYKCAYYYLGNGEDAVEAVQETAYRAFKNRKKFKNGEKAFKAWITKILVNYCKDVCKKRSKVVPIDDFRKVEHRLDLWKRDRVEEDYCTFEILNKMNNPYKEVLILRFIRDMKIKDISSVLERPESTVKSQIKKGLEIFKSIYVMEEEYYVK